MPGIYVKTNLHAFIRIHENGADLEGYNEAVVGVYATLEEAIADKSSEVYLSFFERIEEWEGTVLINLYNHLGKMI